MGKKRENQLIRVKAPQTFREAIPSWLLLIGLAVTCVLFFCAESQCVQREQHRQYFGNRIHAGDPVA